MARLLVSVALALGLLTALLLSGCATSSQSNLNVVTSTSLLASLVERIGGDQVDVVNIIPPAQCPGHFDIGAADVRKLADARLFLMHGWQGEQFTQNLIDSADNPDLTVHTSNLAGNWMTPAVQLQATDEVAQAMCQVDPENCSSYEDAAAQYKAVIEAKGAELDAALASANLSDVKVMCADMLTGFVTWTGLDMVATFGRPDSLTPQVVKDLVDTGRAEQVTLIIDNLQSGKDAGAALAEELGCKRIILSNFPGGFDDTETWESTIDRNVELMLQAVAE